MSRKKIRTKAARQQVIPQQPRPQQSITQTNPLPKGCFLTTEDEPQFRILLGEYITTYNPRHRDEYDLLTEAVYCKWRQQRYWLAETAQIEIAIARNEANLQKELPRADAGAHLANGIAHSEDLMRLYLRYNNQLHRQYLRCLKELRDLQDARPPSPSSPNDSPKEASPEIEHPNGLQTNTDDKRSPNREGGDIHNDPNPAAAQPNVANLTPEQARLEYMKAEIERFEAYRARLMGSTADLPPGK